MTDFLDTLLHERDTIVVCGSGGVGKTTTAAMIGASAAATTDRHVLVITVDPARRLADALGVGRLGNDPAEVPAEVLAKGLKGGSRPRGRLSAAMLEPQASWDALVRRHAPAPAYERIVANPLYRQITGRFVQSHDYVAMERLYELHEEGGYDLVIVDTPPAAHAVDFLDAPARMADFFQSRLLGFLTAPTRGRLAALGARPFLQLADRLLGARFLADITELFTQLETMRPGFIERAGRVTELLRRRSTAFVVVTTPEPAPREEAERLIGELHARSLPLGGAVLNRTLPPELAYSGTEAVAQQLIREADRIAQSLVDGRGEPGDFVPPEAAVLAQVLRELGDNAGRLAALAVEERRHVKSMGLLTPLVVEVPWSADEVADVPGLLRLGATMRVVAS